LKIGKLQFGDPDRRRGLPRVALGESDIVPAVTATGPMPGIVQ
jgi:hypothetical protein